MLKVILEKIANDITQIKVDQARHTAQLEEHMRRTIALETRVEQVDKDLRPVKTRMEAVKLAFQIIGFVATLTLAVKGIILWLH